MHVLLTGAAGFIGSHLAERLCGRGDRVTGVDNFDPFYPRAMKELGLSRLRARPEFRLVEGDITDPHDVEQAFELAGDVDTVVHMAGLAGVRPSLAASGRYWNVNVNGTLHLLRVCQERGVKRIIYASSSSVYGMDSEIPFSEREGCNRPLSPYAATKRAAELMAFNHHYMYGSTVTSLRFFTVYGPRQRPDLVIHRFTNLIAAGLPVPIYGDGSNSRDYAWIDDIVDGIMAAIAQQARDPRIAYRVYNLGYGRPVSLKELVDRISAALGLQASIAWQPEQPGDMKHSLADIEQAREQLGFWPKVSIADGIPRFVAWWRSAHT